MSAKTRGVPDRIDVLVGANIRRLRKALGLSQQALGERLGVSFQQTQKYEKGANRVSASTLARIAEVFEVPIDTLFAGLDGELARGDGPDDLTIYAMSVEGRAFLAAAKALPGHLRSPALALIRAAAPPECVGMPK